MTADPAREAELRLRVAQDLHDGVQQTLAVACMELAAVRDGVLPPSETIPRVLEELQDVFSDIGAAVERLRSALPDPGTG